MARRKTKQKCCMLIPRWRPMRAYFMTTEFATANLFWLYLLKIDQRKTKDH